MEAQLNLEGLDNCTDHVVSEVSTDPVKRRAALAEELMRIYGNAVVLPEGQVIASEQHTASRALREGERDCDEHLHRRRLTGSRIENRWKNLSSIEVAAQNCIRLAGVGHRSKSSLSDEFSTDLLRQHVEQPVPQRSTHKGRDGYGLNTLRNQIRLRAHM